MGREIRAQEAALVTQDEGSVPCDEGNGEKMKTRGLALRFNHRLSRSWESRLMV